MTRVRILARSLGGLAIVATTLGAPAPAIAQFGGDLSGTGGGSGGWSVKPDPPALPLTVAAKDLSIPIPQGFGHGAEAVYPTSPSPFVMLGKSGFDNDTREVWDLRTRTKIGGLRGKIDFGRTIALSADGNLIAGKPTFRDAIEIRSTKNGKLVQTIDPIPAWTSYVDFGGNDQVIGGKTGDKSLRVWSIKTGDPVFDLHVGGGVEKRAIAFSPGRRYLAIYTKDDSTLRVFDLAEGGKSAGEQVVPKGDGDAFNPDCFGLGFSNDATELAAIFEQFGKVRIVAWNLKTGAQIVDHQGKATDKDKVIKPPFYEDLGLQWLPDKSGWLAFGSAIVDRESGKRVWTLPFDSQNFTVSPRRFVDNERALIVFGGNKILRTAAVPYDKVQAAIKIARTGGDAADAILPPVKTADWSGVRSVSYATTPSSWTATPDGGPTKNRLATRPIPLKTKLGEIVSITMSGPEAAQALVACSPSAFGKPDTAEGIQRWADRYDLTGGRHLGRLDLPTVSEVVAFSPDATRLLVRELKTKDRLDVYGVDNKPVAGWRPYEKEAGDARAVTFAAFIDANRVVTLNNAGRLVLWSLPGVKAIYAVDDAIHGPAALSPGRTTLVGFAADTIRFIDVATGGLKGEAPGPAVSVGSRIDLKASAFQADGAEWAGLFSGGQFLRVDTRSGKIVAEFKSPVDASSLEYCGFGHILADGKTLIDLGTRRGLWAYGGGPYATTSPDGRHWFAAAKTPNDPAFLAAVGLPEKAMDAISALLADAKAPAVVRPGSKVSLQLEFGGPPRKADEFRKTVYDLMTRKLQEAGLTVAPGQPVTFTVQITEKNTGETLELRKFGMGAAPGGPFNRANLLSIPIIDLHCTLQVSDASGVVPCDTTVLGMRTFFHLRLPANETDVAAYLKDRQWDGLKRWIETTSMPYFVAKSGAGVVRLPGFTDLNAVYGRSQ